MSKTLVSVWQDGDDEVDQEHHVDENNDEMKDLADVFAHEEVVING